MVQPAPIASGGQVRLKVSLLGSQPLHTLWVTPSATGGSLVAIQSSDHRPGVPQTLLEILDARTAAEVDDRIARPPRPSTRAWSKPNQPRTSRGNQADAEVTSARSRPQCSSCLIAIDLPLCGSGPRPLLSPTA